MRKGEGLNGMFGFILLATFCLSVLTVVGVFSQGQSVEKIAAQVEEVSGTPSSDHNLQQDEADADLAIGSLRVAILEPRVSPIPDAIFPQRGAYILGIDKPPRV